MNAATKSIISVFGLAFSAGLCPAIDTQTDKYFAESPEAIKYMKNVFFVASGFDKPATEQFGFFWNKDKEFNAPSDCTPLEFNKNCHNAGSAQKFPYVTRGRIQLSKHADSDSAKITRWTLLRYKMQADSANNIWFSNGSVHVNRDLSNVAKSVELRLYLNGNIVEAKSLKDSDPTWLLEKNLGKLKGGDTISLAFAPSNAESSGASIRIAFTLEDLAGGVSPRYKFNIAHPAADTPVPPLGENGIGGPSYIAGIRVTDDKILETIRPEVAFLGDSITALWYHKDSKAVLEEKLARNYKVAIFGQGGDWTSGALFRANRISFEKYPPKLFVVLIGTNNLANGYSDAEIVEGNKAIVAELLRKAPAAKVLLMGIFPSGDNIETGKYPNTKKINLELAKLADNKRIFFMDIGSTFIEGNKLNFKLLPDALHPSPAGLAAWADAINPTVMKLIGKEQ